MASPMNYSEILAAAARLGREDRIRLVTALSADISESSTEEFTDEPELAAARERVDKLMEERYGKETPDELRAELERRVAHYQANPETGVSWEDVRDRLLRRSRV